MTSKEIIKKVNDERQTVKAYQDKPIPTEDWKQILETIYWAPTSHGIEPYRVLVIDHKNQELLKEIQQVMWGQGVVTQAAKMVFFISLKREVWFTKEWLHSRTLRRATDIMGKTGVDAEAVANGHVDLLINTHLGPDEKHDDWAMKQAYIALGMAMYSATILGIGSSPMEGFERSKIVPLFIKHGLISKDETVAVAGAFGYPVDKTSYGHWGSGKRVRDAWDKKFTEI